MSFWVTLLLWLAFSVLFEVFENSDCCIWLSKILSYSADYEGGHLASSVIDVMCNMLEFGARTLMIAYVFLIIQHYCDDCVQNWSHG